MAGSGHGGSDGGGPKGWHKGARKHASRTHRCGLCRKITRGNGGSTAHERACFKRHGVEWISQYDCDHMPADRARDYRTMVDKKRAELLAALVTHRRAAGLCIRCGAPIAARFPMHVCHVDGEPDQDGMGHVLDT